MGTRNIWRQGVRDWRTGWVAEAQAGGRSSLSQQSCREVLCQLGLAAGRQAGAEIGSEQGLKGSRDTILRLVQGNVNRPKLLKRSMYGRANFDLLKLVLHHRKKRQQSKNKRNILRFLP